MKKILAPVVLMILISSTLLSQQSDSVINKRDEFRTLFGNSRPGGAYGSFTAGYSTIDKQQAVIFGGKFEWIISHSIGFGFGGNGFINEYHYDSYIGKDVFLTGGYGGLSIEPILLPRFPIHLSFPVLLGAGGISYITKDMNSYHNMIDDSEVFLVAEPAAELEMNVTRHFRLAFGASYKFTTPFNIGNSGNSDISSDALQNWTYMVTFKFGRF